MTIAARLDDIGKPAWIGLMIVSFILFWPAGLVVLGYLIGSGRIMGCWTHGRHERWQQRMQEGMERMQQAASGWGPWGSGRGAGWCGPGRQATSGNHAFDEYRAETLRRLEDEQREFLEFLERLRHAKDKAEFDQFMAERRPRPENPVPQPEY